MWSREVFTRQWRAAGSAAVRTWEVPRGRGKTHQILVSAVNWVPFLHSRNFYALLIDARRGLSTAVSAWGILKALLTRPLGFSKCSSCWGYFGTGLSGPQDALFGGWRGSAHSLSLLLSCSVSLQNGLPKSPFCTHLAFSSSLSRQGCRFSESLEKVPAQGWFTWCNSS